VARGADSPEQKSLFFSKRIFRRRRQKKNIFLIISLYFCEGEDAVKLCQPTWAGKDERQPNAFALATTFGCEKGSDFVPYTPPILRAGNFGNKKSSFDGLRTTLSEVEWVDFFACPVLRGFQVSSFRLRREKLIFEIS
jgi:hypothetical protein